MDFGTLSIWARPVVGRGQEILHGMHAPEHFGIEAGFALSAWVTTHVDRPDRRVDLALLAAPGDKQRHFPDIGLGNEMFTPVTSDGNHVE